MILCATKMQKNHAKKIFIFTFGSSPEHTLPFFLISKLKLCYSSVKFMQSHISKRYTTVIMLIQVLNYKRCNEM